MKNTKTLLAVVVLSAILALIWDGDRAPQPARPVLEGHLFSNPAEAEPPLTACPCYGINDLVILEQGLKRDGNSGGISSKLLLDGSPAKDRRQGGVHWFPDREISVQIFERSGKVHRITILNPEIRTREGLSLGSSLTQLQEAFSNPGQIEKVDARLPELSWSKEQAGSKLVFESLGYTFYFQESEPNAHSKVIAYSLSSGDPAQVYDFNGRRVEFYEPYGAEPEISGIAVRDRARDLEPVFGFLPDGVHQLTQLNTPVTVTIRNGQVAGVSGEELSQNGRTLARTGEPVQLVEWGFHEKERKNYPFLTDQRSTGTFHATRKREHTTSLTIEYRDGEVVGVKLEDPENR